VASICEHFKNLERHTWKPNRTNAVAMIIQLGFRDNISIDVHMYNSADEISVIESL
jgi:hypothetical protein